MMTVRTIATRREMEMLTDDWLRLWHEQPRKEVFTHPAWARVFVEAYGESRGLHVLVAEDKGVRGILPLFRDAKGCLRFIGDPRSDYSDVLCAKADAAAVTASFVEALKRENPITLSAVPEHALLLDALRSDAKHPFTIEIEEPCPAIEFDAEGAVVKELLKKESLRRHEKKIAKLGPISLIKLTTQAEATNALPVLFEQHIARWKVTSTPSLFGREDNRRFYELVIADPVLWPTVDFRMVKAGERIVATHFGFFHDARFIWYKPSFDPELSSMGPGEVLLKHLIAATSAEGACEFDFTRGGEGFKQRFATVTRNNYIISRRTLKQRLRSAAGRLRARLMKRK